MHNLVLIGTSTPILKVLSKLPDIPDIHVLSLFTEIGDTEEVDKLAKANGLNLDDIRSLQNDDGKRVLESYSPDWLFSINSTVILSPDVLSIPRHGAFNMHPGKLPEYAGLHTDQWAIRNGETSFGACIHWMEANVDTGPIAYQKEFPISSKDTGLSLFMKCITNGTELALRTLSDISHNRIPPRVPQDLSKRTLYRHKDALEGRILWTESKTKISNFIRAADYGILRSPTYIPYTSNNNRSFFIRKAMATQYGNVSCSPGTIMDNAEDYIIVATGNGQCLSIKSITCDQYPDYSLKHLFDDGLLNVGDVFD